MLIPCADQGAEQLPVLTESTTRGYPTKSSWKMRGGGRGETAVRGGIISSSAVPRWLQFVFGRWIKRQRRCVICNLDNGTPRCQNRGRHLSAAARVAASRHIYTFVYTRNLIFPQKRRRCRPVSSTFLRLARVLIKGCPLLSTVLTPLDRRESLDNSIRDNNVALTISRDKRDESIFKF